MDVRFDIKIESGNLKTRILAIISGLALMLGLGVVTTTSASAGITPGYYGKILNSFSSTNFISVRDAAGNGKVLYAGQSSTAYGIQDVDAFYVPYGCTGKIGSQPYSGGYWHSLSNNYNERVIVVTC
jgi:hypothetical protein